MALIPDRSTLESLRRADLQKLCKDHGLKANMKSEQLIDLLLDTAQAIQQQRQPPPRQTRRSVSVARSASRDSTSSHPRGRVGSMIIHDLSDDEPSVPEEQAPHPEHKLESTQAGGPSQPLLQPTGPSPPSGPATRTRKAKDAHYKLGIGRPKALGGTGARKLSRGPPSGGFSRGKRVKASVSVQPTQAAIQEEDEDAVAAQRMPMDEEPPIAGPSGTTHDSPPPQVPPLTHEPMEVIAQPQADPTEMIALRDQLQSLQSEFLRLTSQAADVDNLRTTVSQLTEQVQALRIKSSRAEQLEEEMRAMKEEMAALRAARVEHANHQRMESTGKMTEASTSQTAIASSSIAGSPGENLDVGTKSTLGKRQRDSPDDLTPLTGDVAELEQAEQMAGPTDSANHRHIRKRQKLAELRVSPSPHSEVPAAVDNTMEHDTDADELTTRPPSARVPSFTIFSGPEEPPNTTEDSDAPPTTRLSDVFGTVTPPNEGTFGARMATATAGASENQPPSTGGPFSFDFRASIFATPQEQTQPPAARPGQGPAHSVFPMSIPAPEPPTSPSPALGPIPARLGVARGTRPTRPATNAPEQRQDASGRPAGASEPQTATSALAATTSTPQASTSTASHTNPFSAHMMGMALPGYVPLPVPPETPAPRMKQRTMYGTELDADTRFGDFGVEGVATGFWTGAAPRF